MPCCVSSATVKALTVCEAGSHFLPSMRRQPVTMRPFSASRVKVRCTLVAWMAGVEEIPGETRHLCAARPAQIAVRSHANWVARQTCGVSAACLILFLLHHSTNQADQPPLHEK